MIQVTISKTGERNSAPLFTGQFQVLEQYNTVETITAIVYSFCKADVQIIIGQVSEVLSDIYQLGGYVERYINSFKIVYNLPNYTQPDYLSLVLDQTKLH